MKKALILAYHYQPLNVVAARRAKAYADFFHLHGIYPTIVTLRHIPDKRNSTLPHPETVPAYEQLPHAEVYRIDPQPTNWGQCKRWAFRYRWIRPVFILCQWIWGYFDTGAVNDDAYVHYKRFLRLHLKTHHYDMVIASYNPHFNLKLAYELKKQWNIPYILDFRDLWSQQIFSKTDNRPFVNRLQDQFISRYWSTWIRASHTYAITSQAWLHILEQIAGRQGHVIPNGYEDAFDEVVAEKTPHFSIGFMGALYPNQNISIFLKGYAQFLSTLQVPHGEVKLSLLGVATHYHNGLTETLAQTLPAHAYELLPKTDMFSAMAFCKSCWLLWFPAFPDLDGWFSAKLYDFLASRSNILLAPGDGGIVDSTIGHFRHVATANDAGAVCEYLTNEYRLWKKNPTELNRFALLGAELAMFKRSHQAKLMATLVNNPESHTPTS